MFVVGGIIFAGVFWLVGMEGAGVLLFLVGAVLQAIPRRYTMPELTHKSKPTSRAETEKWLRDNGYEPQTPRELADSISEEREAHNKASAAGAFWCGSDVYKDYDGQWRYVGSNEFVGKPRKGN